jgi:hypothetical protein
MRRFISRLIVVAFYALVGYFLYRYFVNLELERIQTISFQWIYLAPMLIISFVHKFIQPWTLYFLLPTKPKPYWQFNFVYAQSWISRYIPGKVSMVAARLFNAEQIGSSKSALAITFFAEVGIQVALGVIIGLILMSTMPQALAIEADLYWLMILLIIAIPIVLYPKIFNFFVRLGFGLLNRLKKNKIEQIPEITGAAIIRAVLVTLPALVLFGLAGYFALLLLSNTGSVVSLYPEGIYLVGLVCFTSYFAVLFLFSPSGLGVRESLQLALLANLVNSEVALAFVVVLRLSEVGADLLYYLTSWVITQKTRAQENSSQVS